MLVPNYVSYYIRLERAFSNAFSNARISQIATRSKWLPTKLLNKTSNKRVFTFALQWILL